MRLRGPSHRSEFHTIYFNQVTIECDGDVIRVYGDEMDGRCIESLDPDTGWTVAHRGNL